MGHYPTHTLAPDPHQRELDLRPYDKPRPSLPIRVSPVFVSFCPSCGMVHRTKADYQSCLRDRDAAR